MAVTNVAGTGFVPAKVRGVGGNATITYRRYRVLSNNTNQIATHDAVKRSSHDILGLGTSSTFATTIASVCEGVSYIDSTGARRPAAILPAATTYSGSGNDPANASYVFLVDNPGNVAFEASVDSSPAIADLNLNCEINCAAATTAGYSQQSVKYSTKAVTATLPVRLYDFKFAPDNNVDATNCHMFIVINTDSDEPSLSASAGV